MTSAIPDLEYRCPTDLALTSKPLRRVMVIGQCLTVAWPKVLMNLASGCECDFMLFNNTQELPPTLPHPATEYDFQLVQLPLRSILPDSSYFRLSYSDVSSYERLFDEAVERLSQFLASALRWNKEQGLLTFVMNFLLPQQNPMGRLMPRYDLRNFVYFVEKLNEALAREISHYGNAYLFDYDQVVATFGRKHLQDDAVWITNHNAALTDGDFELDQERLEPPLKASQLYSFKTHLFVQLGITELLALYKTVRQIDMVKLVVMDIDDTLWRGVAAERTEHSHEVLEGWPLGLAEAIGYLKRRGILLALVSKNEETLVKPIWQKLFGNRLSLDDFAIRKINWRPKAENFEEILQDTNVLPQNAVFVDDNPVERAGIKTAFPGVRVLGPTPLTWRRILLWSAETQLPTITKESAKRTEMVRAQVERETQRKKLSRGEFLATLGAEVALDEINATTHSKFPRALELVNKSNQYNTTGRRWSEQECAAGFGDGLRFFVFDVKDKYTEYGLVGVVIVQGSRILQFVMSCRVVGMEVEIGAIAELLRIIRERTAATKITADLRETELNLLARDLWSRCGFQSEENGRWARPYSPVLAIPSHLVVSAASLKPELQVAE